MIKANSEGRVAAEYEILSLGCTAVKNHMLLWLILCQEVHRIRILYSTNMVSAWGKETLAFF